MPKPITHWIKKYDEAEGNDFQKSIALLCEYSGYFPSLAAIGGGGIIGTWASLRVHSHHAAIVQKVINKFNNQNHEKSAQTLLNVLAFTLKKANNPLKETGDLTLIISVIEDKTHSSFRASEEGKSIEVNYKKPRSQLTTKPSSSAPTKR